MSFLKKHFLTLMVLPIVAGVLGFKWVWMSQGWDTLPLSGLMSALVSANVFLLGFLISGSLPDYKEAEKLPGDLSVALDALADEALILYEVKQPKAAYEFLGVLGEFTNLLNRWFHKEARTQEVMIALRGFNTFFAAFEPLTQANFITRMKQEQTAIRRMVVRVDAIRSTTFIATAYAIAETFTLVVLIGLLFTDLGPRAESLYLTGAISFVLVYMIGLVKDLDNPFHYHQNRHVDDEIALEPFRMVEAKIRAACVQIECDSKK